MCGRFTQMYRWEQVREFLHLFGPAQNLRPRYNVAPSEKVAVIRSAGDGRCFWRDWRSSIGFRT